MRRNELDGLWLIDSDRVDVRGNAVLDNDRSGFQLSMDERWRTSDGDLPWLLRDVALHANVVRQAANGCVVCLDDQTGLLDPEHTSVVLSGNVYQRTRVHRVLARWVDPDRSPVDLADLAAFQAAGQDGGSAELPPGVPLLGPGGAISSQARAALAAAEQPVGAGEREHLRGPCPAGSDLPC